MARSRTGSPTPSASGSPRGVFRPPPARRARNSACWCPRAAASHRPPPHSAASPKPAPEKGRFVVLGTRHPDEKHTSEHRIPTGPPGHDWLSACSRSGHVLLDPAAENLLYEIVESRGLHAFLASHDQHCQTAARCRELIVASQTDHSHSFGLARSLVAVKKRPPKKRLVLILPTSCLVAEPRSALRL
jgi:hypothetical protein